MVGRRFRQRALRALSADAVHSRTSYSTQRPRGRSPRTSDRRRRSGELVALVREITNENLLATAGSSTGAGVAIWAHELLDGLGIRVVPTATQAGRAPCAPSSGSSANAASVTLQAQPTLTPGASSQGALNVTGVNPATSTLPSHGTVTTTGFAATPGGASYSTTEQRT